MKRLHEEINPDKYGGKAAGLSLLHRANDPIVQVPHGFALAWDESYSLGITRGLWAVRSSAIGEDSEDHSFAGQHESILNVPWFNIGQAVDKVRESLRSDRVYAYRRRRGLHGDPKMGVVIQEMVTNVIGSAVIFTRDPQEAEDQDLYVEYVMGLGDKLVSGKVTPESWKIPREEVHKNQYPHRLQDLAWAALKCERIIGGHADVEAAYNGMWWICQARRITT